MEDATSRASVTVSVTGNLTATPVGADDIETFSSNQPLTSQSPCSFSHDDVNTEQQRLWEDAVHRNMNINDEYHRVGVLIVKWHEELDDLGVATEVDSLEKVFRDTYHFETKRLDLHNKKRTQYQLNRDLNDFVEEYDDTEWRNLIIVYYTGHGAWRETDKQFFLESKYNPDEMHHGRKRTHKPCVNWNNVEGSLIECESDVLVILDACFSGNLQQKSSSADEPAYEMLCACGPERLTERPGKSSFTDALIKTLERLAEEYKGRSFSTSFMTQELNLLRPKNMPLLWNRRRREENFIRLAPVIPKSPQEPAPWKPIEHDASLLTLNFYIRTNKLNYDEIDKLTKSLPKAFSNARVRCDRIRWGGVVPRRQRFRAAVQKVHRSASTVNKWPRKASAIQTSPNSEVGNMLPCGETVQVNETVC